MTDENQRAAPIVTLQGGRVRFGYGSQAVEVLHGVDISIAEGSTIGVVGGSGSGKSTLAKALIGTVPLAAGVRRYRGDDIATLSRQRRKELIRKVQLIPQDPYSSLDPRRTVAQSIAEAIDPARARIARHRGEIIDCLRRVQLDPDLTDRYPHQLSGGQRQRVAIARALVTDPEIIIADEITSSLDVTVQAGILDLLSELRESTDMAIVVISHNLWVIREVCDEVIVLHEGTIVERADTEQLFRDPQDHYTRRLLAALPGALGSASIDPWPGWRRQIPLPVTPRPEVR